MKDKKEGKKQMTNRQTDKETNRQTEKHSIPVKDHINKSSSLINGDVMQTSARFISGNNVIS